MLEKSANDHRQDAAANLRVLPGDVSDISASDLLHLADIAAANLKPHIAGKAYRLAFALSSPDAAEFRKVVLSSLQSQCIRPLGAPRITTAASGDAPPLRLRPAKRRLLVLDEGYNAECLEILQENADAVHVLTFADLYGFGVTLNRLKQREKFHIEHARTRITRFSQSYYELHDLTVSLSEDFTDLLYREGLLETLLPDAAAFRRSFRLRVADDMFFQALKIAAIREALIDPDFDHIVVGFGSSAALFDIVVSDPELVDDPRIDCCCLSRQADVRRSYAPRLARARMRRQKDGSLPYTHQLKRYAGQSLDSRGQLRGLGQQIADFALASYLPPAGEPDGRPRVLMLTGEQRGYMGSALATASDWLTDFDTELGYVGGKIDAPYKQFQATLTPMAKRPRLVDLRLAQKSLVGLGEAWGEAAEGFASKALLDLVARHASNRLSSLVIDGMVSHLLRRTVPATASLAVLGDKVIQDGNYALVATCPARSPRNVVVVDAARHNGVPSLTIEPHVLNATYIRYGTILTDYSTAVSDYFADEYAANFGIAADRCFMVGSPRVGRPKDFDPALARFEARAAAGIADGRLVVTFVSQPIAWPALAEVWAEVVEAASTMPDEVRLVLKTHPEDNSAAVQRYLSVAEAYGIADRVEVATADAKTVLHASDLVLTCYSVMAMEAVVREVNVAIVTSNGRDYPMPYHEVLDVPICHSAGDVARLMRRLLDEWPRPRLFESFKARNPHMFDGGENDRLRAAVAEIIRRGPAGMRAEAELPTSLFVRSDRKVYEA